MITLFQSVLGYFNKCIRYIYEMDVHKIMESLIFENHFDSLLRLLLVRFYPSRMNELLGAKVLSPRSVQLYVVRIRNLGISYQLSINQIPL